MSELNKEEKKKDSKLYIIIIIAYLVIALLVTSFSIIFYKNNGVGIIKYITLNHYQNKIEKTPLNEKYYFNNIKITKLYKDINLGHSTENNWPNRAEFVEISGLKDKDVENSINQKIRKTVEELIPQDYIKNDNVESIDVTCYVSGNFSNLLSIEIYQSIYHNDGTEGIYNSIGLNFRLDTGEEIKFKDLFTGDASIKRILSQCAYRDIAFSYAGENIWNIDNIDEYGPDMDYLDYSKVESIVYNFMSEFNSGKDYPFYFTPYGIYIYYDKYFIKIKTSDFYEYINLYRIVPQSADLYEKGNLEKKDFVFGYPYISSCVYNDKMSPSEYLIISSSYDKTISEEDYNKYQDLIYDNLDDIIDKLNTYDTSSKTKIYNIHWFDNNDEYGYYLSGEKIEFDAESLEDIDLENILAECCRIEPEETPEMNFYNLSQIYTVYGFYINENDDGILEYNEENYSEMRAETPEE